MRSIQLDGKAFYPSKIVCVGRNYMAHIDELDSDVPDEPVIFLKPNSSIDDSICFNEEHAVHYEGEISFLVMAGKLCAVGFGLDLTKRELQSRLIANGLPWERAKAFDKAAVFSEFVSFGGSTQALSMELHINGHLVQKAAYELMLHKPEDILQEVTRFLSFEDGDVIMTGTPKGVGAIRTGDSFTGKIFEHEQLLVEGSWVVR